MSVKPGLWSRICALKSGSKRVSGKGYGQKPYPLRVCPGVEQAEGKKGDHVAAERQTAGDK